MPSYSLFGAEDEVFSGTAMHREWSTGSAHNSGIYNSNSSRTGAGSPIFDINPNFLNGNSSGCSSTRLLPPMMNGGSVFADDSHCPSSQTSHHHHHHHQQHQQQQPSHPASSSSTGGSSHRFYHQSNCSSGNGSSNPSLDAAFDYPGSSSVAMQSRGWPHQSPGSSSAGGIGNSLTSQAFLLSGISREHWAEYMKRAHSLGFIVGNELDRVKEKSRHNNSQSFCRISAHFKNKYGETDSKTKAAYLQIGVRVPSKDHVSEIVGKGGGKIKTLREETGALITTPGENEDHVFIIEAPPEIAFNVGQLIRNRAEEITQNKSTERRRGSGSNYANRVLLARGRILVPQEMVGKIIGTQGSIITTIQKDTGTEIKSPPKEPASGSKEPGATAEFEISAYQGSNLQCVDAAEGRIRQAKQLICHLVMRQLERREEEDCNPGENSGRDSGRSSQTEPEVDLLVEQQQHRSVSPSNSGAGSPNCGQSSSQWMWADVVQMEAKEAREVIDRILQESKNKTKKTPTPLSSGKCGEGGGDDASMVGGGSRASPDMHRLINGGGPSMHRGSFSGADSPSMMDQQRMVAGGGSSSSCYGGMSRPPGGGGYPGSQPRMNRGSPWEQQQHGQYNHNIGMSGFDGPMPCRMSRNNNWNSHPPFADPFFSMYGFGEQGLRRSQHGSLDRICQSNGPENCSCNDYNQGSSSHAYPPLPIHGGNGMPYPLGGRNIRNHHVPNMDDYGQLPRDMARMNVGSDPDFFGGGCTTGAGNMGSGNPGNELSRTMSDTTASMYARKMGLPPQTCGLTDPFLSESESATGLRWQNNAFEGGMPPNEHGNNDAASWRNFSSNAGGSEFDFFATAGGNVPALPTSTSGHNLSPGGSAAGAAMFSMAQRDWMAQSQQQKACGIIGDRRKRNTPSPPNDGGLQ